MTKGVNMDIDRDYELWVLLHQASYAIAKAREDELRQFGTSMMQAEVLFALKAIDGLATPAEISRWLFREHHTVSALLNRMERDGLVRQTKDLYIKNRIRVTLTEKGEEAYQRSTERRSIRNILSSLSENERDTLRAYLETLRNRALAEPKPVQRVLPFP